MMNHKECVNSSNQHRGRPLRTRTGAVLCAALLGAAVVTSPSEAKAIELGTVSTVISIVKGLLDIVKSGKSLLTPTTMSSQMAEILRKLGDVQAAIINEMRTTRNQALKNRSTTVFNVFRDLADNRASDPTNASTWSTLRFEQQAVADQMFDIIMNANDVQSTYELATAYDVVVSTGEAVIKIKGEIWPATPSSWNDHYLWLQPAMLANYRMVGSQRHQCHPGFNPGYNPSTSVTVPGRYAYSDLFAKKIANKWYTMTSFWCGATSCNPGTKVCVTNSNCNIAGGGNTTPTTQPCNFQLSDLACATSIAKTAFDNDNVVKVVRESMTAIQKLSGGNNYDAATNDRLLAQLKFVDPWVHEAACGSAPWAYPQVP
jgi:hypothetical protein